MRRLLPLLALCLAACDAPPPQLDAAISVQSLAADYPNLIPLGPLSDIDALLPEDSGQTGQTLLNRAADLRRRARILQAMDVN